MSHQDKDRPFGSDGPWLSTRKDTPYWYITWYADDGKTKRESTGTTDRNKAMRMLAKWWIASRKLSNEDPTQVPLGVLLDRYYEQHASKKKSKTQARIATAKWKKFFGSATVAQLSVVRQEEFVQSLRDCGDSPNYIRRTLSVGKSALLRAVKRQELTSAPKILMPKRKKPKKYRMTIEEAAALFNAATTEHFWLYLLLAFGTAARPISILELKTEQINIRDRLIDFNPPGRDQDNKARPIVAICDTLLPWLRDLPPGFVISWKKDQTEAMQSIKTAFIAARKRAGLRSEITPYTIRRTVATELRRRGVDNWETAGLLGHTAEGAEITEIYAEYSPDYLSAATRAIDDYFRELEPLVHRPLAYRELEEQPRPEDLRASHVPLLAPLFAQDVDLMVGVRRYTLFLQSRCGYACGDQERSAFGGGRWRDSAPGSATLYR